MQQQHRHSTPSGSSTLTPLSLSQLSTASPSMAITQTTTTTMTTSARLHALHERVTFVKESRLLCEKVLSRLQVLNRQLEHMISMSTGSASSGGGGGSSANNASKNQATQQDKALAKLSDLIALLEQFITCDTTRNIVLRLTDARRFRQLQEIHEELDGTFRMLRLEHVDPDRQWRAEWAKDREYVEHQFQKALATRESLFRELGTSNAQWEALAVLQFAMEQDKKGQRAMDLSATITSDLIRSAFRKLVSMATVEIPLIPSWFISPAMLSMDHEPFAGSSQAQVFYTKWGVFKTLVVVKKALPGWESALLQEASLWAQLDHPFVLKMHGGFPVGGSPFVVVEHPVNGSLDEYLSGLVGSSSSSSSSSSDPVLPAMKKKTPTTAVVYKFLWQAASGLAYIHTQQVFCSDLKLSSISVGSDGNAKIGQFGSFFYTTTITTVKSTASAISVSGGGSIRWKAPELLLRGRESNEEEIQEKEANDCTSDVNATAEASSHSASSAAAAVDVYAFAMCMLEAMTGELPWGWLPDAEIRTRVLSGQLPERPDGSVVAETAWNLITTMCAAIPSERPSMKRVAKQLQALVDEEDEANRRRMAASRTSSQSSILSSVEDLRDDEYHAASGGGGDPGSSSRRRTVASRLTMLMSTTTGGDGPSLTDPSLLTTGPQDEVHQQIDLTSVVSLHHKWLGIKINSIGNRVVVSKFLRSSSGAVGEIEASGLVQLGDVILCVNDCSVRGMNRSEVGQMIQNTPRPLQLTFQREAKLLDEAFQFHGLRLDERWRDKGSIVALPEGTELLFGSVFDTFTFTIWFSLSDADDTFYGGVLLGAQDLSSETQAWPYCHHQLVMVDPQGNLSSFFLQDETPVLIARELAASRWYHLAVVYDAQAVTVYLDGEIKHHARGVLYKDWPRLNHLNIGSGCISRAPDSAKPSPDFCGWYGFNGLVYDANVWHMAMRELDVQQLFRGAADFVETPVYSLRRDGKLGNNNNNGGLSTAAAAGSHPPRRVLASKPQHVVAQMYC